MVADGTPMAGQTATADGQRNYLFPTVLLCAAALFLAAPWPFDVKVHAALHGLCAQRPSHSFVMGGRRLPFDARMTGIYGGFLAAGAYLVARGRHRAFRLPSPAAMALLALFVAVMAVDGINSFLLDLMVWHPYAPQNGLRLATGLLTGVSLAVVVCFMLSTTLWRSGRPRQPVVTGVPEVALLAALQFPFALAVVSGVGWLYAPLSLLLLLSAITVVGALMLTVVVIVRYGDGAFASAAQLQGPATLALMLALSAMAAIAGGRFLLEHLTHAPPLT